MKVIHIILPVVALVLVGAWNLAQLRTISSLEKSTATLREKIEAAPVSGRLGGAAKASKSPIHWRQLAGELVKADLAGEDYAIPHDRIDKMSREEIIAALDEIAALDLSVKERQLLEDALIPSLVSEDPAYVLERFGGRIVSDPDGAGYQLVSAMRTWAERDPAAAMSWFDGQIAAGNFESRTLDGKSEIRAEFEGALLDSLLPADPAAAAARLAALPEDQRREVLEQLSFSDLDPAAQASYAKLVRELIPADERAGSFAHIASQLVTEAGYDDVTAFLDGVQATPAERAAAAVQTAESRLELLALNSEVTRKSIDPLRDWLSRQAPQEVNSIIGKSLAEAAQDDGEFNFAKASQLALHYQQSGGGDEVLVAFLKSYAARSNLQEALQLADRIADPQRRAAILDHLK